MKKKKNTKKSNANSISRCLVSIGKFRTNVFERVIVTRKTKFRAKFNNYKSAHSSSYRKKRIKCHCSAFMSIMGNTVITGFMTGRSQ